MELFKNSPRRKDYEDKHPMVSCPACGKLHKRRRNGDYCNMTCYYTHMWRTEGH